MTLAWHFCGATLRDGRPVPPDGVKLVHDGELVMCKSGLHASERIIDALLYAPGNTICRVECGGKIKRDTDKLVCTERTILWRVDGEKVLREFARWCALQVIEKWKAPEIVRRYLETGDESIRDAAGAAAWGAACDAAWGAARDAAWDAAWAAARAADWAAARAAAGAAAAARDANTKIIIAQAKARRASITAGFAIASRIAAHARPVVGDARTRRQRVED